MRHLPIAMPVLKVLFALAFLWAAAAPQAGTAQTAPRIEPVEILLFWGEGCPHCARAEAFLSRLEHDDPGIVLRAYEVWYNEDNAVLFDAMAAARGFEPTAVPTIIIGERYWIGYSDAFGDEIAAHVSALLAGPAGGAGQDPGTAAQDILRLPFIGPVDLASHSIWISTALIAIVDGFNPCSLWVLSVLVALALHAGSRRRVLLIGLTFITVTAAVYALFIGGLFTLLSVASFFVWIRIAASLVALLFAAVNIKDYFFFREGLSFTIDERHKPGLYKRMRDTVARDQSPLRLLAATVVLAGAVSMIEFSCTAGFPVVWTNLLVAQDVSAATFAALLAMYLAIYQLDELAIFLAAVFTLKASRVDERHGRVLKLVGGVLMLALAAVMIADPALLNRVGTSVAVFAGAFAAAGLILFVHRIVLPRCNVRFGNEAPPGTNRPGP